MLGEEGKERRLYDDESRYLVARRERSTDKSH